MNHVSRCATGLTIATALRMCNQAINSQARSNAPPCHHYSMAAHHTIPEVPPGRPSLSSQAEVEPRCSIGTCVDDNTWRTGFLRKVNNVRTWGNAAPHRNWQSFGCCIRIIGILTLLIHSPLILTPASIQCCGPFLKLLPSLTLLSYSAQIRYSSTLYM